MSILKRAVKKYRSDRMIQLLKSVPPFVCREFLDNKDNGPPTNPYKDASSIIEVDSPIIVDAGAYKGEMTDRFLSLFYDAKIHAIEPLSKHIDILNRRHGNNPNVEIHSVAVGESNKEIEIQINPKSNTSSVYESTEALRKNKDQHSSRPANDYVPTKSETVQQVRLDSILSECDIMKLDLQGHELNALKGAEGILGDCKVIITEVSFVPYYNGQVLFEDLHKYLSDDGFRLYNLYVGNDENGQIKHGDALFLEESVYEGEYFSTN